MQHAFANLDKLGGAYLARSKPSRAPARHAPVLKPIKPRQGYSRDHIALGPHLRSIERARERLGKNETAMVRFGRIWRRGAQRHDRDEIGTPAQPWRHDHNWPDLDHFRHNEARTIITENDFTRRRVVGKWHALFRLQADVYETADCLGAWRQVGLLTPPFVKPF